MNKYYGWIFAAAISTSLFAFAEDDAEESGEVTKAETEQTEEVVLNLDENQEEEAAD